MDFLVEFSKGEIDFSQEFLALIWSYFIIAPLCQDESDLLLSCFMKYTEFNNGYFLDDLNIKVKKYFHL